MKKHNRQIRAWDFNDFCAFFTYYFTLLSTNRRYKGGNPGRCKQRFMFVIRWTTKAKNHVMPCDRTLSAMYSSHVWKGYLRSTSFQLWNLTVLFYPSERSLFWTWGKQSHLEASKRRIAAISTKLTLPLLYLLLAVLLFWLDLSVCDHLLDCSAVLLMFQ